MTHALYSLSLYEDHISYVRKYTLMTSQTSLESLSDHEQQYHIKLRSGESAPYVITPGDPGRVSEIASYLDNAVEVAYHREYRTYRGTYRGVDVSVTSTGIGGPSAAIAFEELIKVGARVLIRVGTSGSLQPDVCLGDLVVAQSAIRDEGTSRQYVPLAWPATSSFDVTHALAQAAHNQQEHQAQVGRVHVGVVHCKDAFYAEEPKLLPTYAEWQMKWEAWHRMGALCTEMEAATLFTVAQLRRVRAGAVLSVIGETRDEEVKIAKLSNGPAILTALDAIYQLAQAESAPDESDA